MPGGASCSAGAAPRAAAPAVNIPHTLRLKKKIKKKKGGVGELFSKGKKGAAALPSLSVVATAGVGGSDVLCHPRGWGLAADPHGNEREQTAVPRAASLGSCFSRGAAGLGQGSCCEFTGAALSHSLEK